MLRGPLINGKSLDVRIKKTKIKIKIIAALTPAPDETGFGSMSSAYSGFSVLKIFAYKTTTPIMIIDGTITANSGPTVEDMTYSGTKRANPDKSVTPKTPFNALTEPPTTMTTKKVALDENGQVSEVSGYTCKRGADYAAQEAVAPERKIGRAHV